MLRCSTLLTSFFFKSFYSAFLFIKCYVLFSMSYSKCGESSASSPLDRGRLGCVPSISTFLRTVELFFLYSIASYISCSVNATDTSPSLLSFMTPEKLWLIAPYNRRIRNSKVLSSIKNKCVPNIEIKS